MGSVSGSTATTPGAKVSTTVVSGSLPTLPLKQREMYWVYPKRNEVLVGGGSLPLLLVGVTARTTAHSLVSTPTRK